MRLWLLMMGALVCAADSGAEGGAGAPGGDAGGQQGAGEGEGGQGEGEGSSGAAGGSGAGDAPETLEAARERADKAEGELAKLTKRLEAKEAKIADFAAKLAAKQAEAGDEVKALRAELAKLQGEAVERDKRGQVERALIGAGYDPSKDEDGLCLAALERLIQWDEDTREVVNTSEIVTKAKALFGGVFGGKGGGGKATTTPAASAAGGGGRQQQPEKLSDREAGRAAAKAAFGRK